MSRAIAGGAFARPLAARSRMVQRDGPATTDTRFDDDPLSTGGFGPQDQTIRVRPGAVRAGLILRLRRWTGGTFDKGSTYQNNGIWLQAFFSFFNLHSPILGQSSAGQRCSFNNSEMTITEMIDVTIAQGNLDGYVLSRDEILRSAADRLQPIPTGSPVYMPDIFLTYSVVPATWHHDVSGGPTAPGYDRNSKDKPGQQLGASLTFALHPKDKPGWEVSAQGQITAFRDDDGSYHAQSSYVGAQLAAQGDLIDGVLNIAWINQMLAGAARAQNKLDGVIRLHPSAQAVTGAQIMYNIPGTQQVLSIGGQAAAQFTGAAGSDLPQTFDFTTQIVLQVKLP